MDASRWLLMLAVVRRIDPARYRALHVAVQADIGASITRVADALVNRRKEQAMLNNPLAALRLKEVTDHPRTFEASATKALDTARVAAMGSAWGAVVGDDLQGVGEGAALFVAAHGPLAGIGDAQRIEAADKCFNASDEFKTQMHVWHGTGELNFTKPKNPLAKCAALACCQQGSTLLSHPRVMC